MTLSNAKAAVIQAWIAGVAGVVVATAAPVVVNHFSAEAAWQRTLSEKKEIAYSSYLDTSWTYYQELSDLGVMRISDDGFDAVTNIGPAVKLPESLEADERLDRAREAFREFDRAYAALTRDLEADSLGHANRIRAALPPIDDLLIDSQDNLLKAVQATTFRTPYFDFVDRFRTDARKTETLFEPR